MLNMSWRSACEVLNLVYIPFFSQVLLVGVFGTDQALTDMNIQPMQVRVDVVVLVKLLKLACLNRFGVYCLSFELSHLNFDQGS